MGEIKINVSDKMELTIQEIVDNFGIKKTEFVKSIVIENLKKIKFGDSKE